MEWRKKNTNGVVIVWCETQEEVEDFFDIAEYEGVQWNGGMFPNLRSHTNAYKSGYEYFLYENNKLCYSGYTMRQPAQATVLGSELHNYAISVRLKRGDTRD